MPPRRLVSRAIALTIALLVAAAPAVAHALPAAPLVLHAPTGGGASGDNSTSSIEVTVTPPLVELASASEAAEYAVTVSNNGTRDLTVNVSIRDVTSGWNGSVDERRFVVPAGGSASTSASLRPPANVSAGDAGRMSVHAAADAEPAISDSADARARIRNDGPEPLIVHQHRVIGTAGVRSAAIEPECGDRPVPGTACALAPESRSFRCYAESAVAANLELRVVFFAGNHTGNGTANGTDGGSGHSVAGAVPRDAHEYAVQVRGVAAYTLVTCEFRG